MIKDQFMLGSDVMVAPVVEKGVRSRSVTLPPGRWMSDEGLIYEGDRVISIEVPLERLPYFSLEQ